MDTDASTREAGAEFRVTNRQIDRAHRGGLSMERTRVVEEIGRVKAEAQLPV